MALPVAAERRGPTLGRRVAAEGAGTLLLLATVVGSGIMGERLASGNEAIALLANAVATGAMLIVLILAFGPVSGAHFNPLVTLVDAVSTERWAHAPAYIGVQVFAAVAGVLVAHAMFGEPMLQASQHERSGAGQLLSEFVATLGLLGVIWSCSRRGRPESLAYAVGLFVTAAYWFTASTAFANPAVTIARSFTDTFSGIRFSDVPGFLFAQSAAAVAAIVSLGWLVPFDHEDEPDPSRISKGRRDVNQRERVLILCTGNSARSQMAEGLFRSFGRNRFDVFSAGTKPSIVRPEAVAVMSELRIDLSAHRSKDVAEFDGQHFDYVITVCDNAKEHCPVFPGNVKRLHWSFSDPAAIQGTESERLEAFRGVRDALAMAILGFLAAHP